ncbi:MAG TPA: hypothetical protein VGN20_10305 [Mucilaginibacter sp.]
MFSYLATHQVLTVAKVWHSQSIFNGMSSAEIPYTKSHVLKGKTIRGSDTKSERRMKCQGSLHWQKASLANDLAIGLTQSQYVPVIYQFLP